MKVSQGWETSRSFTWSTSQQGGGAVGLIARGRGKGGTRGGGSGPTAEYELKLLHGLVCQPASDHKVAVTT